MSVTEIAPVLHAWADALAHHTKVLDATPLVAGEMSLHRTALVHCSPGNDNDDRRMGLGISFIPAHVKPQAAHAEAVRLFRLRQDQGFKIAAE
jgi:hypothetical protein